MSEAADDEQEHLPETVLPECPVLKLLIGQRALVTGASSGIGKAVAIALGQAGADVIVNYVSGQRAAEEVVEEIRASGSRAYAYRADVSNEDQVRGCSRRCPTNWEPSTYW